MRDGIEAAGDRHRDRQINRQERIVDHDLRQDALVASRLFHSRFGQSIDRRHLGAGIGRRDRQDRQAGLQRDGLAQTDGRSATHGYRAVGTKTHRLVTRLARDLDRHMHYGMRVNPDAELTEASRNIRRQRLLLRRRQYQRAPRAKLFDLARQMFDGVLCEQHARGHRFEDE